MLKANPTSPGPTGKSGRNEPSAPGLDPAQPAVNEKLSATAPAHSDAHSRLARVPMMKRSLLAVSGARSSG